MYIYRFQNVFLRCPTHRLHCFLSFHWPSFRFLSCMTFFIPSIQFFFGLPRILLCFGIHFSAILGNLPSAIRWTWPYHVRWFCSISFIIVSSLRYLHLDEGIFCRVRRLAWCNDPDSYAGASVATGRATDAGQVKGEDPDKERYTGPPVWGLGRWASTSSPDKRKVHAKKNLDRGDPRRHRP